MTWSLATDYIVSGGQRRDYLTSETPSAKTPVAISRNKTLQIDQAIDDDYTIRYEPDCVWVMGFTSGLAINQLLSHMFDASLLGSLTGDTASTQGDTWLKQFYHNGTVNITSANQYFDGIASTLTGLMRQYGDTPPSGYAPGTQLALQTCVHVQWIWLLFPVILSTLSTIFLGATLKRSDETKTRKGAWRSSSLTLVPDIDVNLDNNGANDTGIFAKRSETLRRLWRLVCSKVLSESGPNHDNVRLLVLI